MSDDKEHKKADKDKDKDKKPELPVQVHNNRSLHSLCVAS